MYKHSCFCLLITGGAYIALTTNAYAHVKWFVPYNISEPPRVVENVFNLNCASLLLLSILMIFVGHVLESLALGRALLRGINMTTRPLEANTQIVIRAACGFFLVALWTIGGIILTPELKTTQPWVSWIQLAIAACLIWRQTLVLAACGLVALYALAVNNYGIFHLLDYPVFIGAAIYLALSGIGVTLIGIRALDILRYGIAITLMWASVEKWAYPHWSHDIVQSHPELTLGFTNEYFMQAAGVIEFALSFAILLGPLVRRTAAAVLVGMFASAVIPFGRIDAIGHAPIIAALLAVLGDSNPGGGLLSFDAKSIWGFFRSFGLLILSYCTLLAFFISAYCILHYEFYEKVAILTA